MPDLTVTLSVGGNEFTSRAYTNSCAPMWQTAGADIEGFAGSKAIHVLPVLQSAVEAMLADPATYEALEPEDESGHYEGCLAFMSGLIDDMNHHPKAVVGASVA